MADVPPNNPLPGAPTGAEPLKKSTGKVQPKKETVRINLPPKPTAAPTIKLPTLPPSGPTGAPSAAPALAKAAAPAAPTPPATPGASLAKPATPPAAAAAAPGPKAAAQPQRTVTATSPSIKTIDKALIYTAAVCSLAAVGIVAFVFKTLKDILDNPPV